MKNRTSDEKTGNSEEMVRWDRVHNTHLLLLFPKPHQDDSTEIKKIINKSYKAKNTGRESTQALDVSQLLEYGKWTNGW